MNTIFNFFMLIGAVLMAFAAGTYVSICLNRYKTSGFKGKIPVIIFSAIIFVVGLVLLIIGIIQVWPLLVAGI